MTKDSKRKIVTAIPGVVLIMAAAGLVTYGARLAVAQATKPKPAIVKTVVVKAEPKVEVPAPEPAPVVEAPAIKMATTKSFVHFRTTRSTSSAILADLDAGTEVTLGDYVDAKWQQATYNGQTGYIAKTYLSY